MEILDTKVNLSGWELDNPIIAASGTFGYGNDFKEFYDINKLGSFSFKGTTVNPKEGNPLPRIAEYNCGIINSVGLENPGIHAVIKEELVRLKEFYHKKVIANISGNTIEEFVYLASLLDKCEQVGIIEVNVSCPNVHGGKIPFGIDPITVGKVTRAVKESTTKPVYIKLTPNVTNIVDIAVACAENKADGIVLINTLQGMRIDIKNRRPILGNIIGGCSGPSIFPVALSKVYQIYDNIDIPIIGVGGIDSADKVIEMMLAGATAVEIGAANIKDPYACSNIVDDLPKVMKKYQINSLKRIIGGAHNG